MGDLFLEQGDLISAEEYLSQGVAVCDGLWPVGAGCFRGSLAIIRARSGDFAEARELLTKGESQLRGIYPLELGKLLCKRAEVEYQAGEVATADAAMAEAEDIATSFAVTADSGLAQHIQAFRALRNRTEAPND